jgi:nucleoside-diphosphate-sugar epimerase
MSVRETILVTGGAGAIGSRLVADLCRNHKVLVLDDLSSGWFDNLRGLPVSFWRGSVTDEEILSEVFAEKPSIVFHLAANFANQNSVDYPQKDLLVNGLGTLKVLEFSRQIGVKRFIYTSSSCVYGNIDRPISEDMVGYNLDTPYAISKLTGEHYVEFFYKFHGLPTVVLRLFNSYGPGEYPGKYRNVIPNFIYRALNDLPMVVTGTGEETRDYTFVGNTVAALILAMVNPKAVGGIFNVGTGRETSINMLIDSIRDVIGKDIKIEYQNQRDWDHITRRCADISKICEQLNYFPGVNLTEGLKATVDWFQHNDIKNFKMYN